MTVTSCNRCDVTGLETEEWIRYYPALESDLCKPCANAVGAREANDEFRHE